LSPNEWGKINGGREVTQRDGTGEGRRSHSWRATECGSTKKPLKKKSPVLDPNAEKSENLLVVKPLIRAGMEREEFSTVPLS